MNDRQIELISDILEEKLENYLGAFSDAEDEEEGLAIERAEHIWAELVSDHKFRTLNHTDIANAIDDLEEELGLAFEEAA